MENWAHLIIGVVAVILAYAAAAEVQKPAVIVVGVLAVAVGLYGIFEANLLGANLQNPADTILHLVVGIWALISARGREEAAA